MKHLFCLLAVLSFRVMAFARQVGAQNPPLEQGKINWGAWIIGVVILLALGMLLYVFIKKNPKKDAW